MPDDSLRVTCHDCGRVLGVYRWAEKHEGDTFTVKAECGDCKRGVTVTETVAPPPPKEQATGKRGR